MPPVAAPHTFATAIVAPGVVLDSRRALMHTDQGWMAVADVHFGYELRRRRQGALIPDWGMAACEASLRALIDHYRPRRLILVGDIMDSGGCAKETAALLDRLHALVAEIVCILGNHDRAALKKVWNFVPEHREKAFHFSHGHEWKARAHLQEAEDTGSNASKVVTHITGHEHPALDLSDGAGLRLKVPAFIQERVSARSQRWILPAFSPWSAGGRYQSPCQPEAAWACTATRVWRHEGFSDGR